MCADGMRFNEAVMSVRTIVGNVCPADITGHVPDTIRTCPDTLPDMGIGVLGVESRAGHVRTSADIGES